MMINIECCLLAQDRLLSMLVNGSHKEGGSQVLAGAQPPSGGL